MMLALKLRKMHDDYWEAHKKYTEDDYWSEIDRNSLIKHCEKAAKDGMEAFTNIVFTEDERRQKLLDWARSEGLTVEELPHRVVTFSWA